MTLDNLKSWVSYAKWAIVRIMCTINRGTFILTEKALIVWSSTIRIENRLLQVYDPIAIR